MAVIEQFIISLILLFTDAETWNTWMRDPRTVATLIGSLVSISGAWLGVFLLLRKMSLTADAISHTVLLGIVVAFFALIALGMDASLSSPFLLVGATIAGVLTVILTEIVQRSRLIKADAALGLVFPLLFAIAVILISRFAEDVHLDTDAVLLGEIGLAWADTNSYCLENCDPVIITPDDARAEVGRDCTNCSRGGISPRSDEAIFEEVCTNCGTYTAAQAWGQRLIDRPPTLVQIPHSLTPLLLITLLNIGFILLFYKELKLAAFDEGLAKALGFRPVALSYALMTLVSLTAVGAFDAVGSILVVAFFVIPAATAYLLTDRLSLMLLLSPLFGIIGTVLGYDLSRGSFFGLSMNRVLEWLDATIGIGGYTDWNVSISASMVLMIFVLFIIVWVVSPRYGLVAQAIRRWRDYRTFTDQLLMVHIDNHMGRPDEATELAVDTLHEHLNWQVSRVQSSLARTRLRGWVTIQHEMAYLTQQGEERLRRFRENRLRPLG